MATDPGLREFRNDIRRAAGRGTGRDEIDLVLEEAITVLAALIPYDLATVMDLVGDELVVRVARGELATPAVAKHRIATAEFPVIMGLFKTGRARAFTEEDHRDGDGDIFHGVAELPFGHCCMAVPLVHSKRIGILTFDRRECGGYDPRFVRVAEVCGKLLALTMDFGEQTRLLDELVERLEGQSRLLTEHVLGQDRAGELLQASASPAMVQVVRMARQVAGTDSPVLITGETGTGKTVLASAIHGWGSRSTGPMVSINCAALPPGLIETELFGHVKGAFTGATADRIGRFQLADGGTLFLDEVAEVPLELQSKLLRVLETCEVEPVGSDSTRKVDVRIIAATNRDLMQEVERGTFREDLYYRLAVFPMHLPPLRARREDIPAIARGFLGSLSKQSGRGPWQLSGQALKWLAAQEWKGNARELVNALERATILARGSVLDFREPTPSFTPAPPPAASAETPVFTPITMAELERRHIEQTLHVTGGRIYGSGGAAEMLALNPNTLRSRMKKHGLGGARDFHRQGPAEA